MKIKHLAIGIFSATMLFSCGGGSTTETTTEVTTDSTITEEGTATTYTANVEASSVAWSGGIVGGGYGHTGTLNLSEGTLEMTNGVVSGGSFVVDMTSMKTTDDSYSEEKTPEMLVGHLSAADFFLVDSFPTAKFVVKSVTEGTVVGDLTIRGITKEATVNKVTIEEVDGVVTAKGNLVFNRQNFDVAYQSTMKDMVISNDIVLDITLVATK